MTKTALNTAQPEYWQLAGNWSPAGIPAATDTVVVPAGIAIQTQASDAQAGTLGYDTGGNARTASTTISGSVTLNELSGETDFDAAVTINSGGALLVNDPTTYISDHSGGSIVVNGMLNLSGTIGANLGWPGGTMGYVDCPGGLTIHAVRRSSTAIRRCSPAAAAGARIPPACPARGAYGSTPTSAPTLWRSSRSRPGPTSRSRAIWAASSCSRQTPREPMPTPRCRPLP